MHVILSLVSEVEAPIPDAVPFAGPTILPIPTGIKRSMLHASTMTGNGCQVLLVMSMKGAVKRGECSQD